MEGRGVGGGNDQGRRREVELLASTLRSCSAYAVVVAPAATEDGLRGVAPCAAAQVLPFDFALDASLSPAARVGVVAARQPLPMNGKVREAPSYGDLSPIR